MKFETNSLSKPGGRPGNEDYVGFDAIGNCSCWVVADGLGGHEGGENASRLAVGCVLESFHAEKQVSATALQQYLNAAHRRILEHRTQDFKLRSMRTTLVVLLADESSAYYGYIGDSRLYHFRSGSIVFQTKDHSVPQAMVNAGDLRPDQIRYHEDRNRLLRALGQDGEIRPEVGTIQPGIETGDAFLLCTDGFWEFITETEMEVDYAKSLTVKEWIGKMEARLLSRAPAGHDNYSAIAVTAK